MVFDYDNATGCTVPGTVISTLGIKREDVYKQGYLERFTTPFQYLEKQNIFRSHEYYCWAPTVRAIISELQDLANGINYTPFTDDCALLMLMKGLDNFWH